jgi:hypothetical protein
MLEALSLLKIKAVRNPAMWGVLLASAVMIQCGFQVAGGTSEVGNPSTAIKLDEGEDADTAYTEVGVRFDFIGVPVQIIKERKPEDKSEKAAANDSASASGTETPSPAN